MSKRNLFNPLIAQSETDDLYNGTLIFRKTRPVDVSASGTTGIIKRGSPLYSSDGKNYTVWQPGNVIVGILLFDIDLSETEEAENATMGLTGEFNQNKIEEALGSALDPAAIQTAWGRQIHIEPSYGYPDAETFPLGK
ncbi:MAG: hypothetical protein FWB95_02585 [Treponema sp.]|nr:hypothetical protein [Treponema sp.]